MKKNLPLIISATIPLMLIALVWALIYFPQQLTKPQYDFIYGNRIEFYSAAQYGVTNSKIAIINTAKNAKENLFYYSVKQHKATPISFVQAQNYLLSSNPKSPDGFYIKNGQNTLGFSLFWILFTVPNYEVYYIQKNAFTEKLALPENTNFHFIGWVLHG